MFTHHVRMTLATDYGIRDIPDELLQWFIRKERTRYANAHECLLLPSAATPTALGASIEGQRPLERTHR